MGKVKKLSFFERVAHSMKCQCHNWPKWENLHENGSLKSLNHYDGVAHISLRII